MTQLSQSVTTQLKTDMKVVNLSDLELTPDHISLLQRGLTFSPVSNMDEFTVYKDIVLFLRKVILKSLYTDQEIPKGILPPLNTEDQQALDILHSLLQESEGSASIEVPVG